MQRVGLRRTPAPTLTTIPEAGGSQVYFGVAMRRIGSAGFSLVELLVLVGVIAVITSVSAPAFVAYWRSATLLGGARELTTIINRGRQVAISQNTTVCVKQGGSTQVQFLTGGCAGTVWTGPGTDGNVWFTL